MSAVVLPRSPLSLDDPPSRYWIATDLDNLITAHNLRATGSLFSMATSMASDPNILAKYVNGTLDYLQYVRNPVQDQIRIAPFALTATRDYTVEVILETTRTTIDPLLPSRLSAVFAFATKAPAIGSGSVSRSP